MFSWFRSLRSEVRLALAMVSVICAWFLIVERELPRQNLAMAESSESFDKEVRVTAIKSVALQDYKYLSLYAFIEARDEGIIYSETNGRVAKIVRDSGSIVQEGDIIILLEIEEAQANYRSSKINYDATRELFNSGYISQFDLAAAEASLESARLELARKTIRSPYSGSLDQVFVSPGSVVTSRTTNIAKVSGDSRYIAIAGVSETYITSLAIGSKVSLVINGDNFEGEVTSIGSIANPSTRTYRTEISLSNSKLNNKIRSGMTAEVSLAVSPAVVHRIPSSALILDKDGNLIVRVSENNVTKSYPVVVENENENYMSISGLPENADIIILGQGYVQDGQKLDTVFVPNNYSDIKN